jgi:hypothetical protein
MKNDISQIMRRICITAVVLTHIISKNNLDFVLLNNPAGETDITITFAGGEIYRFARVFEYQ